MGFICLPVSIFLYWLMLHSKKETPFPKGGFAFLLIAGAVSVVLSSILSMPISVIIDFIRLGVITDSQRWIQALHEGIQAFSAFLKEAVAKNPPSFFATLISMFFSAGLLEEGLKFLTCRIAIQ